MHDFQTWLYFFIVTDIILNHNRLNGDTCSLKNCSCNKKTCMYFGNCCDEVLSILDDRDKAQEILGDCYSYQTFGIHCAYQHIYIITKCPTTYSNAQIRKKCEALNVTHDLEYGVPTYSRKTKTLYKNVFCAMCHGIYSSTEVDYPEKLSCKPNVQLELKYRPGNMTKVDAQFQQIKIKDHSCVFDFLHSKPLELEECFPKPLDTCDNQNHPSYNKCIKSAMFLTCCRHSAQENNETNALCQVLYKNTYCFQCDTSINRFSTCTNNTDDFKNLVEIELYPYSLSLLFKPFQIEQEDGSFSRSIIANSIKALNSSTVDIMFGNVSCSIIANSIKALNSSNVDIMFGIITTVGSSVSIITLLLVISIYIYAKLASNWPGAVIVTMCVALLCRLLFFIIAYRFESNFSICRAMGFLVQFFFLSGFMWTFVMAVILLKGMKTVSTTNSSNYSGQFRIIYGKISVVCWGIPLLICSLTLFVDALLEDIVPANRPFFVSCMGYAKCWFNGKLSLILFFIVPVSIIILLTIIIIILVIKLLIETSRNITQTRNQSPKSLALLCIKISTLYGVTWIMALLPMFSDNAVFIIAFDVINSLHGFAVAVVLLLAKNIKTLILKARKNCFKNYNSKKKPMLSSNTMLDKSKAKDHNAFELNHEINEL